MLVAENIWPKQRPAFHFSFHMLRNYDGQKMHQANSWRSLFYFWGTSEDGKKRLRKLWRSKSFEREQVSPGMGFFGRTCRITFVLVIKRHSPNCLPSSRRPKRKAVQDPNLDSQRSNLDIKRRKVDDNVSCNYIL
jgi:hypothetical protein